MNSLSNITASSVAGGELLCRIAENPEKLLAMRMVLGKPQQPATEALAMDFFRLAFRRGIDPAQLWVAMLGNQLVWAALPVLNPGRTLLLFVPADYANEQQARAARQLTERMLRHYTDAGAQLAQVLFDPVDQRIADLHRSMDFVRLAELIYLQLSPPKGFAFPALRPGMTLLTYNEQNQALFSTTIQQSYVQSLDCPGLSEMRNIKDVLAGHKAAGEFDPRFWFLLMDHDIPAGVALLNPLPANQTMELVYLGVVPEARRKGIGEFLFRHALATTARSAYGCLTFPVDSSNRPALNLYYHHGMQRIGSKIAMLRDLRK